MWNCCVFDLEGTRYSSVWKTLLFVRRGRGGYGACLSALAGTESGFDPRGAWL